MPFDASVFAQSGRPTIAPVNPMDATAGALDTVNKLNNIRQFQANQAVGEAYQQATGADGTLDQNMLRSILSQDSRVTPAMQQAQAQSESLQTSQQARGLKAQEWANATLPSLLALPDGQLHDGAAAAMDQAVKFGFLPQSQSSAALAKLPSDPTALRAQLNSMQLAAMPAGAQRSAMYGTPIITTDGQTSRGGVQLPPGPGGGGGAINVPPQAGVPIYPSRETILTQQSGIDPVSGAPTMETLADRARRQGQGALLGPAGNPGQVPPALLPPGYRPPAAGAAPAPPAATQGASQAAPSVAPVPTASAPQPDTGPIVTGLVPGEKESIDAAVAHHAAASAYGQGYQDRMQPLLSAQAALKDAKTGVGTDILNRARQALSTFTPSFMEHFRPLGGSPEENAAYDEANKYLTSYAGNTAGASRSDAGGATAAASNASVKISPLAAQYVVRAAIGMERSKQAQLMEFDSQPIAAGRYDSYMTQTASKVDPRAFLADMQTPQERLAYYNGLNGTQRQNYLASVRMGVRHGLMGGVQ